MRRVVADAKRYLSSRHTPEREVFLCADCGALVGDQGIHDRFHSILNSHAWALAVLQTSHVSAEVHAAFDVRERIQRRQFDNWSADALAEVMAEMGEDRRG